MGPSSPPDLEASKLLARSFKSHRCFRALYDLTVCYPVACHLWPRCLLSLQYQHAPHPSSPPPSSPPPSSPLIKPLLQQSLPSSSQRDTFLSCPMLTTTRSFIGQLSVILDAFLQPPLFRRRALSLSLSIRGPRYSRLRSTLSKRIVADCRI